MKKIFSILYVSAFLLIPLILLIFTNNEKNVVSSFDNRKLVEMPQIGDADYETQIENYLQDRIGFRNQIVTAYQYFNDTFTGELTHPLYMYGQDDYLFFKMHDNIEYGSYHQTFAESVVKMKDYCEARNIPFYFMFDPEKISVYRRYLPEGVNYNDEWVDSLLQYLIDNDVKVVNNRDLLIEKSYSEQVFNKQYDAGHWNDLGCFYGTNNLWKTVNQDFPEVTEYKQDEFDFYTRNSEFLANSRYIVSDEITDFVPKYEWESIGKSYDNLKIHPHFKQFNYYINNSPEAEKLPKMLVFHGSYYNSRPEFFIGRAREYIGIHDYQNVLDIDYYINVFQPEMVVFEVAEYTFYDSYFDSSKMSTLDYNPEISREIDIDNLPEEYELDSTVEKEFSIFVISGKKIDSLYCDIALSDAKYVYLISDGKVIDLQKDENGSYVTGVPHDYLGEEAALLYEDYKGNRYYKKLSISQARQYADSDIIYSEGACFLDDDEQYMFETDLYGNRFNAVNVQIIDDITGVCLDTIETYVSEGNYNSHFVSGYESGWYRVRLKANSNLKDEGIDCRVYLIEGEQYFYSFDITGLDKKKVVIDNYELFGPCP